MAGRSVGGASDLAAGSVQFRDGVIVCKWRFSHCDPLGSGFTHGVLWNRFWAPRMALSRSATCPGALRCPPHSNPLALPLRWSWPAATRPLRRSEEHTSELQSLMRISYAVFCLKKKTLL